MTHLRRITRGASYDHQKQMIMLKLIRSFIFTSVLIVSTAFWFNLSGQISNTYYYMYGIPQANQLNPAFQPQCNGYFGIPGISPLNINVELNSIGYKDIFTYNDSLDAMITFMHSRGDKDEFLKSLKDVNTLRADISTSLLSIGWRKDDFYFTIDATTRVEHSFNFTKDFMEFAMYLNKDKNRFNFSGMGMTARAYNELAIGISYNYDDNIQVGAKAKVLFGLADFTTRSTDITLRAYDSVWTIDSEILTNVSVPFLDLPVDDEGFIIADSMDILIPDDVDFLQFALDNKHKFLGTRNLGVALDFGFIYSPIENLEVSASVNDLGLIRWKNDSYTLEQDVKFDFTGIEVDAETIFEDSIDGESSFMDDLTDSVMSDLKFTTIKEPYTTFLAGKVYIGAAYEINEKFKFGVVDRVRIYNQKIYNQLTLSANVQPISLLSATVSYSIIGDFYTNIGFGLSLRAGPLNIYFITDQAPSIYLMPPSTNSLNFRFGMNLVFGCARIPKKLRDRPLID